MIRTLLGRVAAFRPLPWMVGGGLLLLVIAWTLVVQPRYRSTALLQVQGNRMGAGLADALSSMPGAPLLGLQKDELETEIGVLRSRRVIDAVIDTLGLTVRLQEPIEGKTRFDVVQVAYGPGRDVEGVLRFSEGEDGYAIAVEELTPELDVPARVVPGQALVLGGLTLRVGCTGLGDFTLVISPRYEARRTLESRLDVRRQSAGSQLIALTFDDPEPAVAAAVLERMLAEYLEFTARAARGELGSTAAELRRQIETQQRNLVAAENTLRAYQERTGLVMPAEQAAAEVERYAELRMALDKLEVERNALARLLELVNQRAEGGDAQVYRQLATMPSLISNGAIQDLLVSLTELENDRAELRMLRTDENADVRQLSGRIAEIERQLHTLGTQYLESLDEHIAPTRATIAEIDAKLVSLPERELQFVRLSRERAILNEGYLAMQRQLRQTELQDALRLDQVRVVDAPTLADADDPEFPRPLVNLVLGLVLAVTGGGAVGFAQSAVREGRREGGGRSEAV